MKPISRKENIVVQKTGNETLICDLLGNKAFLLNETSAFVWNMCDGNSEIAEISEALAKQCGKNPNDNLVWLAIDGLRKQNLLAESENLHDVFAGLSRREVIKKVGIGTMIALPIVATLIAPKSINASSLLAPGYTFGVTAANCSPATQASDCTSGGPTHCQSGTATAVSCNGGANLTCKCS